MEVDAPTTEEEQQYFEPGILTITRQWHVVYKLQFQQFLKTFNKPTTTIAEDENPNILLWSRYEQAAIDIARFGINTLIIHFQDLLNWQPSGLELSEFLRLNFLPVSKLVDESVDEFVKDILKRYLAYHREQNPSQSLTTDDDYYLIKDASSGHKSFYCTLTCNFESKAVRDIRCEMIGQLINLRGTATRSSDIRPELKRATFKCQVCDEYLPDVEQQYKYTEPLKCTRKECKNRNSWQLISETCQFEDWQKVKLQENSSEIAAGSMPRWIDILLTRRLCDRCKPGDKLIITGCLAAVPDVPSLMKPGEIPKSVAIDRSRALKSEIGVAETQIAGLKKIGARDLSYRLVFMAQDIKVCNAASELENDIHDNGRDLMAKEDHQAAECRRMQDLDRAMTILGLTPEQQNLCLHIGKSHDTLDKLAKCVAPEIFGCENVKKGILLMIVGGVEKITGRDNLKLRGDINICIVGDPGTAKSQLLKWVKHFAPRSVYTAGNTSTAAGLTVSISKDPDQGDAVIEAGALMLADKGICCIDEFDKMAVKDMIAIHEAMEQQTISICKGGVQATLNARASILAACNPRGGRYDLSKPFRHNVRLSAPIISRFDLFFVMLDHQDDDDGVAWHIVNLHLDPNSALVGNHGMLNRELLRKYLMLARSRCPKLTLAARNLLVRSYVSLRAETLQPGGAKSARVTVRSLESLIRLSEAIAKVKFATEVTVCHVEEAIRLMQASLLKLERTAITLDDSTAVNGDTTMEDETRGEGANRTQNREITLDADEFDRITSTLINRLRDEELNFAAGLEGTESTNIVETIIPKDDLITWYLENYRDDSVEQTDEVLVNEYEKIEKVINRMINHDMSLIEEIREVEIPSTDGEGTEIQRVIAVRLHPNYCADTLTYGQGARHTTLPTSFFVQPNADVTTAQNQEAIVQDESWTLDDDDFMAEMYGWNQQR